jgi:hypothetical protein
MCRRSVLQPRCSQVLQTSQVAAFIWQQVGACNCLQSLNKPMALMALRYQ